MLYVYPYLFTFIYNYLYCYFSVCIEILRLLGPLRHMHSALEALFHRIFVVPPPEKRLDVLRMLKRVRFKFVNVWTRQIIVKYIYLCLHVLHCCNDAIALLVEIDDS